MYIANVVADEPVNVDKHFNIVTSYGDIDTSKPTIIVGWEKYVKQINPDCDFIDRKLSDNVYWTFSKREKRGFHDEDIYNFVKYAYQELISDINYIYLDYIQFNDKKIAKVLTKIKSLKDSIAFKYHDMIYIYGERLIFGIDIKLLRYLGRNIDNTINFIKDNVQIYLDDEKLPLQYDEYMNIFDNEIKYIPYIYHLEQPT